MPAQVNGDGPAVLLVDDRSENLLALRAVLEPLSCRLVSASSGDDALKALLKDHFAAVLLDVQMPGIDGFQTAELIKARARTRTLPIIFVTAISKERHHVFRGYAAGAVDYVFKPYDPSVLRSKVSVFLELDSRTRAAQRSEAILHAAFDDAPIGMARLDPRGRVMQVNRALARLLERRPAELAGLLLDSLAQPDDVRAVVASRDAAVAAGGLEAAECEARLLAADGGDRPCALSFSLARPAGGAPGSLIVQVLDLRDRRRAEQEREQRIRERLARVDAERASERLHKIQRISDAALSTLAFEDLVLELLARTLECLAADAAAIMLQEQAGETIIYETASGLERGAQMRRRVVSGDASATPVLGDLVTSTLAAPLQVAGHAIGELVVGTRSSRRFSSDDRALLELAAERGALGIQRARLYQREHRIAEQLQRSLLPAELPAVDELTIGARYFPAGAGSQVGGDWYDAVLQPDGRLLLAVGDVAGRGIDAAATMGQLRSALRAYALDGHAPGTLLERLNAFHAGMRDPGIATVALVSVDLSKRELRFARAGHPPALLVDPAGAATWLDAVQDPPLGTMDDTAYSEAGATLAPGAVLALYTDGLVERRGEPLDIGLERLRAATADAPVEMDALCDLILTRTLAGAETDDDVTLLVTRSAKDRRTDRAEGKLRRRSEDVGDVMKHDTAERTTHIARVVLPGGRGAGAAARRALGEVLADLASAAELADARLAVVELVTNAVVHGGAETESDELVLRVAATPALLRFELTSSGATFAVPPPTPRDEPGGFGLVIVEQLASRWGIHGDDDVRVWLELDRKPLAR